MDSEPLGMQWFWRVLGQISLRTRIALDDNWKKVHFQTSHASLELKNLCDLAVVNKPNAVSSELSLQSHSLVTGPNRGGKSTVLRATLQSILLGQTFG